MAGLFIEVSVNESLPSFYTFDRFPVLVGRSPDCHLAICHESVPREMFSAWLEKDSNFIRVEPRPDLKNPVMYQGAPLCFGVSERSIELSVGPVRLHLSSGTAGGGAKPPLKKQLMKRVLVAAAFLFVAISYLGRGCAKENERKEGSVDSGPIIPESIDLARPAETDRKQDVEFMLSSADDALARKTDGVSSRVRALSFLLRAAEIVNSDDPERFEQIRTRADNLHAQLNGEYRLCRRAWVRAVESRIRTDQASAAACLLPWLRALQLDSVSYFESIVRQNRKDKPQ